MLPTSFSSKNKKQDPLLISSHADSFANLSYYEIDQNIQLSSPSSESDSDSDSDNLLPISSILKIKCHRRTVSAISIDPSGAYMVTGGRDCTLKFFDFQGMDMSFKPYKIVDEPCGGNPIRDLQFSLTGDQVLLASASTQPKLYNREGIQLAEFTKGDMYLRDMKQTKGHISAVTHCQWHPFHKDQFCTSSVDGTVRFWNCKEEKANVHVLQVKSKVVGGRTSITGFGFNHDGSLIGGVGQDGEIRVWDSRGPFLRPEYNLENAHENDTITPCLNFSPDTFSLLTRSYDGTLKLFDLRNFNAPVATVGDLPCNFEETNAIFSPRDNLILTGTSSSDKTGYGKLCFFDKSLSRVHDDMVISEAGGAVIRVYWHSRINQIFSTTTDGHVQVNYSETESCNGAKIPVSKGLKKKAVHGITSLNNEAPQEILNPNALPMYKPVLPNHKGKLPGTFTQRRNKMKPENRNILGEGHQGLLGASEQAHFFKALVKTKDTTRDEDPREAILKYAEDAKNDPYWIAPAYQKTQPKTILNEKVLENELEEILSNKKQRPN